ncbi:MAG TPA: ribosomal-protein-alanine N-acetyltransferase [Nitrospirae bacterium]|nr:ribosomal-protein-alanine N-acetyltransferase [Nitrospirota bacterium]
MEGIEIRNMSPDDIQDVLDLEHLCFTTPWSRTSFMYEMGNKSANLKSSLFNHRLIGYVCLRTIMDVTHVLNLAVSPEFRRMGVGSRLLREALQDLIMLEPDIDFITLEVRESNKAAVKLYENFGFRLIGKRTGYYHKPPEDAVLMGLEIEAGL